MNKKVWIASLLSALAITATAGTVTAVASAKRQIELDTPTAVTVSKEKPTICITNGEKQSIAATRYVQIPQYVVRDDTDSGIRATVRVTDKFGQAVEIVNGDEFYVKDEQIGEFTITYDAVNSAGLQADTVTATLTVEEPQAPALSAVGTENLTGFKKSAVALPRYTVGSFYDCIVTATVKKNGVDYTKDLSLNRFRFIPQEVGTYTVAYTATENSARGYTDSLEFTVEVKDVGVLIPFILNQDTSTYVSTSGALKSDGNASLAIVKKDNFADKGFATTCMEATYNGVVGSNNTNSWPGIDISLGKMGLTDLSEYSSVSVDVMYGSSGRMMLAMMLTDGNGKRYEANYWFNDRYEQYSLSVNLKAAATGIDVSNVQTVTIYTYGFEEGVKKMYFSNFSVNE